MASNNPTAPAPKSSTEFQLKKYLLLLATLVATVTYAAGLNLPGGVWPETQRDHPAGDPILPDAHHRRYLAFYYCNATAFAASLVVCLLLLVLDEGSTVGGAVVQLVLQAVMALDLLALMGAYAAGSCRDAFTTIYSSVLVSAVFAYVVFALPTYVGSMYKTVKEFYAKKQRAKELRENPDKKKGADPENRDMKQGEDAEDQDKREEMHEVLMLLAIFAVTITYVAGLNPPGGFWGNTQDGHRASDPVLQDHNPRRYQAFFVCNTTAFVASLLIIMLLLNKNMSRRSSRRFVVPVLYVFVLIALLGLVGAYTAGSCREGDNSTYVLCLAGAILAYIILQVVITIAIKNEKVLEKNEWLRKIWKWLRKIWKFFGGSENKGKEDSTGKTQSDKAWEEAHDLVMLLATLVASITYQAGLDPPGGLWLDDRDGHKGGDPILLTTHPTRYKVFFYCNSAAFVASLVVIVMVQSKYLLRRHTLEAAMILDLFALIGAYASGSCRDVSTSIYVVAMAGAVLVYVVIHIIFFTLDHKENPEDAEKSSRKKEEEAKKLANNREVLLLLAILAATLTYQAGLTPPGGFWSADDKFGHYAGLPVLLDNYPRRYKAFFYCNAASLMASVALIVLLVNPNLYRPGIRCYALYVCMVAGMFGLMGAYAAGSSRHLRTSIYVLTLVAAVLVFVTLQVVIFGILPCLDKIFPKKGETHVPGSTDNQPSGQGPSSTEISPLGKDPAAQKISPLDQRVKDLREYLMLLGMLAASVTYQAGLKPPGGLWQDNNSGHRAGNSILHDINKRRYLAFFYSNSASFMASIVVIVLLLPSTLDGIDWPLWPMHTAILLDMIGLLGAYAAGSTRDWETSRNVIALVVPVLACFAACAAVSFFRKKRQCCKGKSGQNVAGEAKN